MNALVRCGGCTRDLPASEFGIDRSKASRRKSQCRPCSRGAKEKWRRENLPAAAAYERERRRRNGARPRNLRRPVAVGLMSDALERSRARNELYMLDDGLELMQRGWKPTDWPREPRQSAAAQELMRQATRLIEDAERLSADPPADRFGTDLDVDAIVVPSWCHLRDLCEAALERAS